MQGFKLMYCFLSASGVCMQMVVQNIEQTNFLRVFWGADAGFQVDVFLRVLRGCVCRWLSKTLSKQTSSECFWGADAGFQVDVLLPQSASGVCMQMVVQNIEQTNFLRVLLGCGCRVSS